MRAALAWLAILVAPTALSCRQLAGIENLELSDAGALDGRARSDGPVGALDAGPHCECPGCTTLAVGLSFPVGVARSGHDLYVTNYGPAHDAGSLVRIPTSGGSVHTVADKLDHPSALVTDDQTLYWMGEDGKGHGAMFGQSIGGANAFTLVRGLTALPLLYRDKLVIVPTSAILALTASNLYYVAIKANGMPTGIFAVPKTGGSSTAFAVDEGVDGGVYPLEPLAISVSGDSLVFIDANSLFSGILRAPFPTGPLATLASNLVGPVNLAASKDRIFFLGFGLDAINGTVQAIPAGGGPPTQIASGITVPWNVLVDDGFVYVSSLGNPTGGDILKFPVDGGTVTTLASKVLQPVGLATDTDYVYWVDAYCNTAMRIHK